MSIKISYKKAINEKTIKNYVLFSNEEFKINGLNKLLLAKNSNQVNKTIKSNKGKNKNLTIKSNGHVLRTNGNRSSWKKAIVTLEQGSKIDILSGEV